METPYHIPALLGEAVDGLDIRPGGTYVDVTLGGGGHSRAIIERLSAAEGGHLYGMDRDREAVDRAPVDDRFTAVWGDFRYVENYLNFHGRDSVDGILADLGVSFHHFDDPGRGFSFRADGPLDMRMNRDGGQTAADVVNTYDEARLADVLYKWGELKNSRRLAAALVAARPVDTTARLLEAVRGLVNPRQEKKELACLFQALRIEVNQEMTALEKLLGGALRLLKPGGRLCVITYHSLEDRLVKNFMKTGRLDGRTDSEVFGPEDIFGKGAKPLRMLTSKPVTPSAAEVEANPRSRSAKLRVAEKL